MKKFKRIISSLLALVLITSAMLTFIPIHTAASNSYSQHISFNSTANAASRCLYLYFHDNFYISKNCTPETAKAVKYNKGTQKKPLYVLTVYFRVNKRAHLKISRNGKTEDLYLTPKKYEKPAKSVYIGNQLYFVDSWAITMNNTPKGKLQITPKKDWKIEKIFKYNIKNYWNPKYTYYKNGDYIKINKNERFIILFTHKKSNKVEYMMYDSYFNHSTTG